MNSPKLNPTAPFLQPSGLIGRAMPHDRDSPHHTPYKDTHHIRGSISQGTKVQNALLTSRYSCYIKL